MTTTPHRSQALDAAVNDAFDDVDLTLTERYGSAKHPERPVERARAAQLDDATVDALGKLSEGSRSSRTPAAISTSSTA